MSGKFLLDTNIVIELFANNEHVTSQLETADEIYLPSIVLGELYYGAYKSSRFKENITQINKFSAESQILSVDSETARYYGNIKNEMRAKGKPIPENDLWIAALSRQHKMALVTQDAHFDDIHGLERIKW